MNTSVALLRFIVLTVALLAFALQVIAAPMGATKPTALKQVLAADATLHDVTFVNRQTGWAVGDRGVVLATDDGGKHWFRQPVPVDCSLLSVSFVDAKRGWIVGGDSVPLTHRTRGVVLRTIDGGLTWQQVPTPTLPRLTSVQFFDAAHGIATSYGGAFYPSGLFASRDGGKSWQPLAADERTTWLASHFVNPGNGALAGAGNVRGAVIDRELQLTHLATNQSQVPCDMVLNESLQHRGEGWLVGTRGMIAHTSNGGASWQPLATPPVLPTVGRVVDWQAVATHQNHVWITGNPGTQIFHSADGGATWQAHATGSSAPIRQLTFIDAQHGWGVGDLGTLLATDDGGVTWQVQRAGGQRTAMLALCPWPQQAPLEITSRYAAGKGYRTLLLPLFATAPKASATTPAGSFSSAVDRHRQSEAMLACGGELARPLWGAPPAAGYFQTTDSLLAELHRQSDGKASEQLHRQLVAAIRTWRPAVLLVPHERNRSRHAANGLVEQLTLAAIEAAADPTYAVDLTAGLALPAWQVRRVVGLVPPGERGMIRLPTDDFVSTLAGSPARWASTARGLLFTEHTVPPPVEELELIWQQAGLATSSRDLFAGLNLPSGSEARRPLVVANPNDLDRLRRLTQKRRQLVRLLDHAQGNPAWSGQVVNLTGGLDPQTGGELLYQLSEGYRETGRLAMSADTLYLLVRRYPDHPLAEQALVWLVQYYASGELAHVTIRQQAEAMRTTSATKPLANVNYRNQATPAVQLPEKTNGAGGDLSADERLERASLLGNYLKQSRPAVYAEPALRFPLAVASRRLGFSASADKYFLATGKSSVEGAWQRAARGERWLAEPSELPPEKPIVGCRLVPSVPHLDGKFNEAIWQKAETMKLASAESPNSSRDEPTATVRLCRDANYLYVAIVAPRLANESYDRNDQARPRDADLAGHDRIHLSLDIDRDYRTAYELTIDCRGWTHDAVWGDAKWNPKWYVASQLTETEWTAELAIPWSELSDPQPAVRDTWALRVERHTPHGHQESWTGSTSATPDSFGLLLFR